MRAPPHIACAALLLALAACGGGGSDNGNSGFVPPTDAFNVRAAWQNMLTQSRGWSGISGRDTDNHVYTVSVQIAPAADAPFPLSGTSLRRSTQTITTQIDGGTPSVALNELFFDAGFLWQGARHTIGSSAPSCDELTAGTASLPPTAVTFGAAGQPISGALLAGTIYGTCTSRTVVRGTATTTWSLEFEAGIVYFCLNTSAQDLLQPPAITTESDCVEAASDGSLRARARVTLTQSISGTETFRLVARN